MSLWVLTLAIQILYRLGSHHQLVDYILSARKRTSPRSRAGNAAATPPTSRPLSPSWAPGKALQRGKNGSTSKLGGASPPLPGNLSCRALSGDQRSGDCPLPPDQSADPQPHQDEDRR